MIEPTLLIASGLDPSGGAGFIVDVRVAHALSCRATGVVTASTVQNQGGARSVAASSVVHLQEQLVALLEDGEPAAVKIGLVPSAEIAELLARTFSSLRAPVVWDPVLVPSRGGARFSACEPVELAALLAPVVTVITPNRREAELLSERSIADLASMMEAGVELVDRGFEAVLVKGGHLEVEEGKVVDCLVTTEGVRELWARRHSGGTAVHGTGCALSMALACELARGAHMGVACELAGGFVRSRIEAASPSGAVY
jgi:hydroxymethylpyrimidine/phosphomethylpyrimidine kinase